MSHLLVVILGWYVGMRLIWMVGGIGCLMALVRLIPNTPRTEDRFFGWFCIFLIPEIMVTMWVATFPPRYRRWRRINSKD